MLQRIQTIWTIIAVFGSFFLNITAQDFDVLGGKNVVNFSTIALVLLGLLSVFSYKTRKLQLLLNTISIVINALLVGLLIYWLQNLSGGMQIPEKGIEPIFPFISIVCLLLANVNIRKDDRLVKSVDRLR